MTGFEAFLAGFKATGEGFNGEIVRDRGGLDDEELASLREIYDGLEAPPQVELRLEGAPPGLEPGHYEVRITGTEMHEGKLTTTFEYVRAIEETTS